MKQGVIDANRAAVNSQRAEQTPCDRRLRNIGEEEFRDILRNHGQWLKSKGRDGKRADLANANLGERYLSGTNFQKANLRGASLRAADLCGAILRGADLRDTDFRGANLRWVDIRQVPVTGAKFQGADLYGADVRGTILEQAPRGQTGISITNALMRVAFGSIGKHAPFIGAQIVFIVKYLIDQ